MPFRPEQLRNLDDGFTRAIELVVTPAVFVLIGYVVDRALGTTPVFSVVLGVFAVVGSAASMWFRYDSSMRQHESELAARSRGGVIEP